MNKFAVLAIGYENLHYPLGRKDAHDLQVLIDNKEKYVLHKVNGKTSAKMILDASDFISEHSSLPVGFVLNEDGNYFVVCHTPGKTGLKLGASGPILAKDLDSFERKRISKEVIARLAMLHSQGFGCGGLSLSAVEIVEMKAKLLNPSKIFALTETDSIFYEVVSTLRSLVSDGFATRSELKKLASFYLSYSPVCRHAVAEHFKEKGVNMPPTRALVEATKRVLYYY